MVKEIEKELINVEYDLWEFEDKLSKDLRWELFKIRQKLLGVIIAVRDWDK